MKRTIHKTIRLSEKEVIKLLRENTVPDLPKKFKWDITYTESGDRELTIIWAETHKVL